jgi:lysyl-tRNA synthetase class 1
LPKARAWLTSYNPEEIIELRDTINADYAATMDDKRRGQIRKLRVFLESPVNSISDLEHMVYAIPKDPALDDKATKVAQRGFFKDVYNLLISRDAGPRLSTFLWAVDRATVVKLLAE